MSVREGYDALLLALPAKHDLLFPHDRIKIVSISIWRKCILIVPILFPDVSLLSPTIDMVKRSKITVYYYKWHATDFYLTIIDATGGLHKDGKVCTFETLYDTLLLLQIL